MAEILALVAALCFALAATLQQKGALGLGDELGSAASYLRLAREKAWLLGTLVLLLGYVFQAIALDHGRLAVIQPLLVTTIVFALPLGYLLTNQVVTRVEVGAAALVVVGLAVYTVVGAPGDGNDNAPASEWAIAVMGFGALAAALVVVGRRSSPARKAALLGASAGVLFGLSASLCKPTMEILNDGGASAVLTSWELSAFAAAGIIAFVVLQVSLATGRLAPSVAAVSVCNPIVSIAIGVLLLDETLQEPTWRKLVAYGGLLLALFGASAITSSTEGGREEPEPAPA